MLKSFIYERLCYSYLCNMLFYMCTVNVCVIPLEHMHTVFPEWNDVPQIPFRFRNDIASEGATRRRDG